MEVLLRITSHTMYFFFYRLTAAMPEYAVNIDYYKCGCFTDIAIVYFCIVKVFFVIDLYLIIESVH